MGTIRFINSSARVSPFLARLFINEGWEIWRSDRVFPDLRSDFLGNLQDALRCYAMQGHLKKVDNPNFSPMQGDYLNSLWKESFAREDDVMVAWDNSGQSPHEVYLGFNSMCLLPNRVAAMLFSDRLFPDVRHMLTSSNAAGKCLLEMRVIL